MGTYELDVISAVTQNKDIHHILGVENEMFGAYEDVAAWLKTYYLQHKSVPDKSLIVDVFPDIAMGEVKGVTPFYIERLREEYVRGRIGALVMKAGDALDKESPSVVYQRLTTALAKLGKFSQVGKDVDVTDADLAREHFKRLREQGSLNGGSPGIQTGFKSIDSAYTTGMAPGHSIIVLGYTGRGKSMWSDLLAVKVWEQNRKPMIVSLEMSAYEQLERIYAIMGSGMFRISDLSRGNVSDQVFDDWADSVLKLKSEFVVVSSEGISVITPNVIQAKIDVHKPDLVILDYLQLMMDNSMTGAMTPRMLNLSREIKMLAVTNNIPIVSMTAVTDEDNDKRDSPPMLSQVSWSSGIEYDANLAMAIHLYDDTNLVECVGRKNRHGPLWDFKFEVDFDQGIWTERFDI